MKRKKYLEKRRGNFWTHLKVINTFPGDWESIFKGEGGDFAELREYQPGDDLRKIHWPTVAKMNEYMVREDIALKDLKVFVVADLSAGMGFRTKPTMIDVFTGLIGSFACRSNIPFGFLGMEATSDTFFPVRSGWKNLVEILEWLISCDFSPNRDEEVNFGKASDFILSHVPPRSVVFLLSDFSEELEEQDLRTLARNYDTIAVVIRDRLEAMFPEVRGEFIFRDLKGKKQNIWLNPASVRTLNQNMQRDLERTMGAMQRLGADTLFIGSPDPEECYLRLKEFFFLRRWERTRRKR